MDHLSSGKFKWKRPITCFEKVYEDTASGSPLRLVTIELAISYLAREEWDTGDKRPTYDHMPREMLIDLLEAMRTRLIGGFQRTKLRPVDHEAFHVDENILERR